MRDTGIGIPAEKLPLVFEAFTQADNSTSRCYGGTGLGLTICKKLVGLMGGRIWAESEVGKGTTFHFTADLRRSQSTRPAQPPCDPEELRGLPALVVDDNATNRRILEQTLLGWGLRPTLVDGGRAALEELRRATAEGRPYPLVLLDAMMPEMDGFDVVRRVKEDPQLTGATILMLSSAAQLADAARCRELGVALYLVKPVRQSELLEAIRKALPAAGVRPREVVLGRPRAGDSAAGVKANGSLRILLAEDNPTNQKLAVRLLEKRGHAVVVAADGKEALAALEKGSFDLCLMDVHMPVMNGFEATAAIRKAEEGSGGRLPIIALTANAMKGDRERCLQGGFDDYVSKPIDARQLFEAIGRFTAKPVGHANGVGEAPAEEALDRAALLERVEGDEEMLAELVAVFLEDCPRLLAALGEAIGQGNAEAVREAAHGLKGSVGYFGSPAAQTAALRLETMGQSGDLTGADAAFWDLERKLTRLRVGLAGMIEGRPAAV